ncbi:UNVERIFIED_CONTAM: Cellulose synthase-like protein E6 [Sesamum radiatum]|uniref:Cellulose synthase-like protein E6 n=1 Tax=Sesamum radiatum TaxID=300843 RepID=A0AAW2S7G7_SESRA
MDGPSPPLNARRVLTKDLIVNRLYMLVNGIAILALFYYRATTLLRIIQTRRLSLVPYLTVIFAEIMFTFMWVLYQAYRWRPVKLEVYPERLPGDEKLPPVDVFICTADPSKEPSLGVMNTVVSALALDYPPDKLAVYLQDDAYFSSKESAHEKFIGSSEFAAEKKIIEKKYAEFEEALEKNSVNARASVSRDHPPVIEVMTDENGDSNLKEMPLLVYIAREKRPGHPHHFKGGALNALLRVSAVITNAPYFVVLDCDMYCHNPLSARLAMCFYLDPKLAPKIAWVQFPQKFHNLSEHDIYGGSLNAIYVGYRYFTVVEDAITSLSLHCKGWISVYIDPASPCFLGATTTNLNDMLVQQTRWAFGLMQIGLSRFNPLIYGPLRMSILQSLCYAYNFLESLYVFPVYCLAIIPPICLLYGIPLYPKVSEPYFIVFAFIFLSSRLKHVQETIAFGDPLRNTVMYILNLAAFYRIARLFQKSDELLAQAVLSLFVVIVNYHLLEGMFLRKDKGRIAPSVTLLSIAISAIILGSGSLLLFY